MTTTEYIDKILNIIDNHINKFDLFLHIETTGLNENVHDIVAFYFLVINRDINIIETSTIFYFNYHNDRKGEGLNYNGLKNNRFINKIRKEQEKKFNIKYDFKYFKEFDLFNNSKLIELLLNDKINLYFINDYSFSFCLNFFLDDFLRNNEEYIQEIFFNNSYSLYATTLRNLEIDFDNVLDELNINNLLINKEEYLLNNDSICYLKNKQFMFYFFYLVKKFRLSEIDEVKKILPILYDNRKYLLVDFLIKNYKKTIHQIELI